MCDEAFDEVGSLMNLPQQRIRMAVATVHEISCSPNIKLEHPWIQIQELKRTETKVAMRFKIRMMAMTTLTIV